MTRFYFTALEAAAASIVLVPIIILLGFFRFRSIKTTILYLMFSVYLTGVYAVVGLPNIAYIRFDLNVNLIPFTGMLTDLSGTVLNVILFIPLGLFLFLNWRPFRRIHNVLLTGFLYSLSIEILQIFTFRATDVNDLITNTLGALAGYGLGMILLKIRPILPGRNRFSDLFLITGISSATMFFCQPLIWNLIY